MKKLIPFLLLFPLVLFGEETISKIEFKEVSVAPEYLTEKADSDAINVGVVEIVEAGEDSAADAEAEEEAEENPFSDTYLAGPAEILASLGVPLAFTGLGAGCGMYPATQNYAGMCMTPLTVTAGTVVGAICGAVFTPCIALKGIFDTFTLGAFVNEDYDITDTTDIVESHVDFVNDIATLNNPFDEDEVIEIVVEEVDPQAEAETETESEAEPEPETETEAE
ncbi:hypothetical protein J6X96_04395 [bacterium]|nr:hypothetical protein [bacterium]